MSRALSLRKFLGMARRDWSAEGDAALLRAASRGEEAACRTLLERHTPRLLGLLDRAQRDPALSEDLAQEAFLRALAQAHTLREEGAFFPWLARIALRLAIDAQRKRRLELTGPVPPELPSDRPPPDARLAQADDEAQVRAALERLRPRHREVLGLMYFGALSVREIASAVGRSEVAVRKDLERARRALRDELEPWFAEVSA